MSTPTQPGVHEPTPAEFLAMQRSHEFEELRITQRKFTFPLPVAFFSWYVVYVLLATSLPDWMGTPATPVSPSPGPSRSSARSTS